MKKYLVGFYIFLCFNCNAQIVFYKDIFNGGVTGDGFNPWFSGSDGYFVLNIPTGSTIKEAYLFCNVQEHPINSNLYFNNQLIHLNHNDACENEFQVDYGSSYWKVKTLVIDVKNYINPNQNTYHIIPPEGQLSPTIGGGFTEFYLLVCYENPSYQKINPVVIINNQNADFNVDYQITDLNPINLSSDLGLALHTGHFCDTITEGSYLKVNNIQIGLLGGVDAKNNISCAGVTGSFYYQNGILEGLSDDTPDDIMRGSDAIAVINNYNNSNTSINLTFTYQGGLGPKSNPVYQIFLAYVTNCETFPTDVTTDTSICQKSPLQLSASGGTQYLWQPATDLSCTTCPNPVFTGDSSRFYTVRIWNNDSCSVVRPVKIHVKPLPSFSNVQASPSICGGNTGSIVSNSTLVGESYSINGGALQTTGGFPSLSSGTYTVTLHELNGCTRDTIVTVGSNMSVNALFTATPNSGGAPLTVYFNNQSTNATGYEWFLNNQSQGNSFSNFTFDTTGIYTVTLVAWQNDPSCAVTFSIQIHVYDSLIVQVPNVFTPNNDGKNDIFGIQANIPVSIDYQILNRWGNVMISGKEVVSVPTTSGNQFAILWDGGDATEGTYFYKIEVTALSNGKKEMLDGFMELVR